MALSRKVAKELCTSVELSLYDDSTPKGIIKLSSKDIESKIKIAKNYRDKYSALYKTQAKVAKSKQGNREAELTSYRTSKKEKIFQDCLERFERGLAKAKIDEARLKRREERAREKANRVPGKKGRKPGSKNKKGTKASRALAKLNPKKKGKPSSKGKPSKKSKASGKGRPKK
ncbi:hypothetical protein [Leptospira sp. GIMC2001]|uniref:hypothetical protein n=1 Tax=Leptospira sp. GIMC2001 TaxID=1513297 RepID=UPI00234A2E99|nr:hypothetical protein [Leptospira sp. GIMC2001]WCL48823.1 hypothetical protein O4O04_16170 [Leptospira sp. GIMC2001]